MGDWDDKKIIKELENTISLIDSSNINPERDGVTGSIKINDKNVSKETIRGYLDRREES